MKFGIIGYGNLGKAVASALLKTGQVTSEDIHVCDKSEQALSLAGKEHFHIYALEDINYLVADTDVICLVVKGYIFEQIAPSIDKEAFEGKLVISFMAGETIEKITSLIGDVNIARAMPSLAIAQNDGVIAYTALPKEVADIFDKFGYAFETAPEDIEKVTAFASCGLGFAAYLIDAFATAGTELGFSQEVAALIAARTFKNACDTGDFRETVKAVATPGGATEQGINHMYKKDIYGIVAKAVLKAYNRMS